VAESEDLIRFIGGPLDGSQRYIHRHVGTYYRVPVVNQARRFMLSEEMPDINTPVAYDVVDYVLDWGKHIATVR
jgi:hypothetical protein